MTAPRALSPFTTGQLSWFAYSLWGYFINICDEPFIHSFIKYALRGRSARGLVTFVFQEFNTDAMTQSMLDKCQIQEWMNQIWGRNSWVCWENVLHDRQATLLSPSRACRAPWSRPSSIFSGADGLGASWATVHQSCPEGVLLRLQGLWEP